VVPALRALRTGTDLIKPRPDGRGYYLAALRA